VNDVSTPVTTNDSAVADLEADKPNLLGLSEPKLVAFMESLGEKPFRAKQLMKWMHHQGVVDFDAMTNISKVLRERLKQVAVIEVPEVVHEHVSEDGTRKWALRLKGGSLVETVLIPEGQRSTLCVSSQIGCSLDCSFCSTGKQGYQRDLGAAEIVAQLWLANHSLGVYSEGGSRRITNVVMMGMGEPLMNFDNVVDAANLMMDDNGYGLSKRRVTLSTSGVVPAMEKLVGKTDVSLAISLHAPNDALRNELVPINRKYPISELLRATRGYMENLPDRSRVVVIEYTLIKGVNDLDHLAQEMSVLLRDVPCKINLIPFNPFPQSDYKRPSTARVDRFKRILQRDGYIVTVRSTRGDDIDAACGQLVGQVQDRTRRNERYRARLQANESIIKAVT
jgi:23S rRNA (adenine2503-C2)-methyltransferase